MDNVHLEVEQLTVNRMLRGRVEVRLHAVEGDVAVLQVLVKETDGAREHEVGGRVQLIAELRAFLVKLFCGAHFKGIVLDAEFLTEVSQDGEVGLKINWSLHGAERVGIVRQQETAKVQMFLAGPLMKCVFGVLSVVELEAVLVVLLAVRDTGHGRHESDR